MAEIERADWQAVGASFRTLGKRLKEHAVDAGGAMRTARTETEGNAVDEVTAALKAAMTKLDATTTDPEVAAATRDATAKFLDAVKAELTGGGRSGTEEAPPAGGEPGGDAGPGADGPPKPIEPGTTTG
jgi:hypothetical protein